MKAINKIISVALSLAVVAGLFVTNAFAAGTRMGDVDFNGSVDVEDALIILSSVSGEKTLSVEQRAVADVSYDGKINSVDALRILLFVSNQISSLDQVGGEEGDDIIL
ncbi:MAG TPA: hypothetical protein DDY98_00110 [Ruminococcaceae bacterium]|nr:hypothetical protein [Oscillospiraceae bacterium]